MKPRMLTAAVAVLIVLLALAGCGGGSSSSGKKGAPSPADAPAITIGTKNFTEQFILGELYKQALEASGFKVELKSDIGSSEIVDRALTAGSLDMYPEYTGVVLSEIAREHARPRSPQGAYRRAKAFEETRGFTLLAMTPFSDSNALAVTPKVAREFNLSTIKDLSRLPRATIGAPPEFRSRFEGLAGLRQLYGLTGVRVRPFKIGEQYAALDAGQVDAAAVFTTDGQLMRGRYVILSDPRGLFAYQNVAPVIRAGIVRKYPKVASVVNSVSAQLTTEAMRAMNAAAVQRKQPPAQVAAEFLRRAGLLEKPK
jgi:osmoprotectant transport system substrate-binding protein